VALCDQGPTRHGVRGKRRAQVALPARGPCVRCWCQRQHAGSCLPSRYSPSFQAATHTPQAGTAATHPPTHPPFHSHPPTQGGIYHGRILLPAEYPFKPPAFMMLTPNGRFQTGTKICLSISSHHPEHWQPSWSVRTALTALIAFMPTPGQGAIGSLVSWHVAVCAPGTTFGGSTAGRACFLQPRACVLSLCCCARLVCRPDTCALMLSP
jgi:hypothetical protein